MVAAMLRELNDEYLRAAQQTSPPAQYLWKDSAYECGDVVDNAQFLTKRWTSGQVRGTSLARVLGMG